MPQKFAALNSAFLNFNLATSKIHYFDFHYLESLRKNVNFLFTTLQNIFLKFNYFSWKIHENNFKNKIFAILLHNTATSHPWFLWFWQSNPLQMIISVLMPRNALTRQYQPMNRVKKTEKSSTNINGLDLILFHELHIMQIILMGTWWILSGTKAPLQSQPSILQRKQ